MKTHFGPGATIFLTLALVACAGGPRPDLEVLTGKDTQTLQSCIEAAWGKEAGYTLSYLTSGNDRTIELNAQGATQAAARAELDGSGRVRLHAAPTLDRAVADRLRVAVESCV